MNRSEGDGEVSAPREKIVSTPHGHFHGKTGMAYLA
jgi:hypothetical protein